MNRIACLLCAAALSADAALPLGDALRQRLEAGQPITIAVLGDSVAEGMSLPFPEQNGYPVLLARMLHDRYGAQVQVLNLSLAGASTDDGLRLLPQIRAAHPDLAVLNYGGNDKGTTEGVDNLPHYESNLRQLIGACWAMNVPCIVLTPPMHEPVTDMPFPLAARRVAKELGVPVADVDTALKVDGVDYRGIFPYFAHPRERGHAIIAVAAYQAVCELLGRPLALDLRVPDVVLPEVQLGSKVTVPLRLRQLAATTYPRLGAFLGPTRADARRAAGDAPVVDLLLPHTLSTGRSLEWPLWVTAEAAGEMAFALKRVAVVPILDCPQADTPAAAAPLAVLGVEHLSVVEENGWTNDADLSAAIRLACDEERLVLRVDVLDDRIRPGMALPYGDGIEVYLDLRSDTERGKPYWSPKVAMLFVPLQANDAAGQVTTLPQDQPLLALDGIQPHFEVGDTSYAIELTIPRAALDEAAGRRVTRLGLDLAIDDADLTRRDAQLMWLGRPDNYVNARDYGELRLDDPAPPDAVRVTVF